jgi:hypothetical protein
MQSPNSFAWVVNTNDNPESGDLDKDSMLRYTPITSRNTKSGQVLVATGLTKTGFGPLTVNHKMLIAMTLAGPTASTCSR